MRIRPTRFRALAFVAALLGGCYTEEIEPGWYTPPAQKPMILKPSDVGLDYEEFECTSPAGYTLYGWFMPADNAPATILIHHGALGNRSAVPSYYTMLHELGYHVAVYDYKGFGESTGAANLGTLIPDADAALAYLAGRPEPGARRIILYGISLGTLPTIAQAADPPAGVIAMVVDGSFDAESLPAWSAALVGILPFPEVIEKVVIAYPELDPRQYIGRITIPKLFLHSLEDTTTLIVGAARLYEAAPQPKQFCEVFGGHILSSVLDPTYKDCVAAFLKDVVAAAP